MYKTPVKFLRSTGVVHTMCLLLQWRLKFGRTEGRILKLSHDFSLKRWGTKGIAGKGGGQKVLLSHLMGLANNSHE